MIQFQIDKDSDALQTLDRLMNMNTELLHTRLARSGKLSVQGQYLKRWGGRAGGSGVHSFYRAIKATMGGGDTRGLFTHTSWSAITGVGNKKHARIFMKGKWPNTESASYLDQEPISLAYLMEIAIDENIGLGKQIREEWNMTIPEYAERYANVMVHPNIGSGGFKIHFGEGAPDYLKDRTYPAESYSTKKFQTGPGARREGKDIGKQIMLLDPDQQAFALNIVEQYINELLGLPFEQWSETEELETMRMLEAKARIDADHAERERLYGGKKTSGPLVTKTKEHLHVDTKKAFRGERIKRKKPHTGYKAHLDMETRRTLDAIERDRESLRMKRKLGMKEGRPPKMKLSEIFRLHVQELKKRYRRKP